MADGRADATTGTIEAHPAERIYPLTPEAQQLAVPALPAGPAESNASRSDVVLTLVATLSGLGFALISGNRGYLVLAVLVLLATVAATVGVRVATKRRGQRQWQLRRTAYEAELDAVVQRASLAAAQQRAALGQVFPSPGDLLTAVRERGQLWERRPAHPDFGAVRLGLGPVSARVQLTAESASSPLATHADVIALDEAAAAAVRDHAELSAAPVIVSLTGFRWVSVVGDRGAARQLVASWVAQLAALHSPDDLAVTGQLDDSAEQAWDWTKWLPHNTFGGTPRSGAHCVVVVDAHRSASEPDPPAPAPRTTIVLCPTLADVPADCAVRVELGVDGICTLIEAGADQPAREFVADACQPHQWADLARWLAARRTTGASGLDLDAEVRLTDLVDDADPLPPLLRTAIGRDETGRPLVLDLREASFGGIGPHGIVIGATGSGKSELLRSLVLGLTQQTSPTELNVLLVDFKGGAAFHDLAVLPHCAGLITNLGEDVSQIDRMQAAIDGEIRRRQELFKDAGALASIQAYRARADPSKPTLPFLVVVVDEFGELLEVRPEFLATLGTIGRLGRSLGIHLVLASQRLDEGRLRGLESHLSYRLALRTFTAAESHSVIGSSAAAELPAVPGVGYLAADGNLLRFRAATTRLPATELEPVPPPLVEPFTLAGIVAAATTSTTAEPSSATAEAPSPTDAELLVRLAVEQGADHRTAPIWLPPLPEQVTLDQLGGTRTSAELPLGLIDDPAGQAQIRAVVQVLGAERHVAIIGGPGSGRSTFVRTLVQALAAVEPPERFQTYVLDLGGSLHSLAALPHTGALAGRADGPSVRRIVSELCTTVDERARLLAAAGCATWSELNERPDRETWLPDPLRAQILLVVDGLGQLRADFPEQEQQLAELAINGPTCGVHLALTGNRWLEFRPQLLETIVARHELTLVDPADSGYGRTRSAQLPRLPGRGLIGPPPGREVQWAVPGRPCGIARSNHRAPEIAPLPYRILEPDPPPSADPGDSDAPAGPPKLPGRLALGIREQRLAPVDVDLLDAGAHLLVFGDSGSGRTTIVRRVVHTLSASPGEVRIWLVDPARTLTDVAELPGVDGYAYDARSAGQLVVELDELLAGRQPASGLTPSALARRDWVSGPQQVLVVDDLDLIARPESSPLAGLVQRVRSARDLGFHVVAARRVAGSARGAMEPFFTALREAAPVGIILAGDRTEGPLLGDRSAELLPPGRGWLVRPRQRPLLIQTFSADPT